MHAALFALLLQCPTALAETASSDTADTASDKADEKGCGCATDAAGAPGAAVTGLIALGLSRRRRQGR